MIGSIIGYRYEVQSELAADGLFTIYRGMDAQKGRLVKLRAVHPLLGREPDFLSELERVCERHFQFHHPGLERVLDLFRDGPEFVVVCEYDEGSLLEERLKRLGTFQAPAALTVCIAIAEALEACHSSGVIHGDINAANVFSKRADGVTLMCAGYWEAYALSPYAARTAHLSMAPYLAPEISAGAMPSPASDLYSLGILAFRLLSGRFPYTADNPSLLAQLHATALPPSLRRSNTAVPVALDHVILRCLAKNPQDRYQSAGALLKDLRMIQDSQRFGKPIRGITAVPETTPTDQSTVVRVPSARAKAAEPEPKPAEKGSDHGKEDGLPLWAAIMGWLGLVTVLLTVGWWLQFSLTKPDDKIVPNLVGLSEQEALQKLTNLGLQMQRVEKASGKPKGEVISVSPPPGREIKASFPVKVTLSAGSLFVETPDLRGRTVDEARQLLQTVGLDLSKDRDSGYDPDLSKDLIIKQSPPPREKLQRMSKVRVTVNSGIATDASQGGPAPWHTYRLQIPLPDSGSPDDLRVRVEMSDDEGPVVLHEGTHRPGAVLGVKVNGEGAQVVFRVYVNDLLWETVQKSPPPRQEEP